MRPASRTSNIPGSPRGARRCQRADVGVPWWNSIGQPALVSRQIGCGWPGDHRPRTATSRARHPHQACDTEDHATAASRGSRPPRRRGPRRRCTGALICRTPRGPARDADPSSRGRRVSRTATSPLQVHTASQDQRPQARDRRARAQRSQHSSRMCARRSSDGMSPRVRTPALQTTTGRRVALAVNGTLEFDPAVTTQASGGFDDRASGGFD